MPKSFHGVMPDPSASPVGARLVSPGFPPSHPPTSIPRKAEGAEGCTGGPEEGHGAGTTALTCSGASPQLIHAELRCQPPARALGPSFLVALGDGEACRLLLQLIQCHQGKKLSGAKCLGCPRGSCATSSCLDFSSRAEIPAAPSSVTGPCRASCS